MEREAEGGGIEGRVKMDRKKQRRKRRHRKRTRVRRKKVIKGSDQ
jgi:hypothetical protein